MQLKLQNMLTQLILMKFQDELSLKRHSIAKTGIHGSWSNSLLEELVAFHAINSGQS